jgi:hypothetical protein
MFRVVLASIALAVTAGVTPTPTPNAPASFSLVLESSATGWAARCDTGCHWRHLSFGCEHACGAIIDADGVVTLATPRLDSTSFRFYVRRAGTEIRATARAGTAWKTLTWTCDLDPCRARVDTYGVSGMDRVR